MTKNQNEIGNTEIRPVSIYRNENNKLLYKDSYAVPKIRNEDNYDTYKNFRIVHNTSQGSFNTFAPQNVNNTQKTESSINITEGDQQSIDPIIKESSKQLSKINEMLEEHRKKKSMKPINDSLEATSNSSVRITKEYIQEMKEKLASKLPRILSVILLILLAHEITEIGTSFGQQQILPPQQVSSPQARGYNSMQGTPNSKKVNSQNKFKDKGQSARKGYDSSSKQDRFELTNLSPRADFDALDNGIMSARNEGDRPLAAQIRQALMPQTSKAAYSKIPIEDRLLMKEIEREVSVASIYSMIRIALEN